MINRLSFTITDPTVAIEGQFRIVEKCVEGRLCGDLLQSQDYGVVQLQGSATGEGPLVLGAPPGRVVRIQGTWEFDWIGTFAVWIATTGDYPQIQVLRIEDCEPRPNRIIKIAKRPVTLEHPFLLAPLIGPLNAAYFGRHPRTLFPLWPQCSADEECWGWPLLPPL